MKKLNIYRCQETSILNPLYLSQELSVLDHFCSIYIFTYSLFYSSLDYCEGNIDIMISYHSILVCIYKMQGFFLKI